jgi:hypothetical protein
MHRTWGSRSASAIAVPRNGCGMSFATFTPTPTASHCSASPASALAQHPGQLPILEQHVVGPLEARDRCAQQVVHDVREHETGADRHNAERRGAWAQQHGDPCSTGR